MRRIIVASVLLVVAAPAFAQDAKPNTLTPKEIADGWILLFDGETTFGWKADRANSWTVKDGNLLSGGNSLVPVVTNTAFGNYQLSFDYRTPQKDRDSSAQVLVACSPKVEPLKIKEFEAVTPFRNVELQPLPSRREWQQATITVKAGYVAEFVHKDLAGGSSGSSKAGIPDQAPPRAGHIAFAGESLELRNVKLKTLRMAPLFTGKDLAGWKVFPGKKSEFAVIDGAINIKNGPGDLQTEKKFGDFCLQLECISHGEHLNSGVFFRCRPGEYQNGYEAQVRNQFTEKPTQKYLLEEYDSQTHKLLGKKESLFTAVDFGTGAIYRRQPARKGIAKDKEWFTMTVVAHGNHFATWVNGIQATDWYDNRPPSDNARTGYRAEAGHISLQGHDPTTNLSFKNFRIQEYPPTK